MKRLLFFFSVTFSTLVYPAPHTTEKNLDELSGIVINRSYSPLGKDFFYGFSQVWLNKGRGPNQVVTVQEHNTAVNGSYISVIADRNPVYQVRLNRRQDNAETGRQAAKFVMQRLRTLVVNRSNSVDLADDEF